jgi:plastocyanin domain-containing protein
MRKFTFQIRVVFAVLLAVLLTGGAATRNAVAKPRVQTARVRINERGYEPIAFKLRRGVPARVTFVRTTDATCAKEIVLPDFNIRRALPLNRPIVVNFTPKKRGTFTFVCGMNMMRGQLIVQ